MKSLVVARQAAKTRQPSEGVLGHPAARQKYKAVLGFRQFDHLQLDAALGRSVGSPLIRVALVNVDQIDAALGGFLHLLGESINLRPLLFAGGRDQQSEQVAQGVYRDVYFAAFLRLSPS